MTDFPCELLASDFELAGESSVFDQTRLAESWERPDDFAAASLTSLARRTGALASRLDGTIQLYSDLIARHARGPNTAVVSFSRQDGWRSLSYAELDRRASARAAAWRRAGVKPASCVAIVLDPGPESLVAYGATLRLGARACFVPPVGARMLAARLEALAPDHTVFDPYEPPPLEPRWHACLLPSLDTPVGAGAAPVGYAPEGACATLLAPLRHAVEAAPLPAIRALQAAARDALLVWKLSPGTLIAAPFAHPTQHLPALWNATLLAGATWVHIPDDDLRADAGLFNQQQIHTAVLGNEARRVFEQAQIKGAERWSRCFRHLEEPLDWPAWSGFFSRQRLARVPCANVLIDSSAGGAVLASALRPGSVSARALPVAGQPWALKDGTGVFAARWGKKPAFPPWFILGAQGTEFLYGGAVTERRDGRVFPSREVVKLAETAPGCLGAAVVPMPDRPGSSRFALCVMLGARAVDPAAEAALKAQLRAALGTDAEPDVVTMLPGFPRRIGKKLDEAWMRQQYRSGMTQRKAENSVFAVIRALRAHFNAV